MEIAKLTGKQQRADDLGLGDRRVRAVAVFHADERLAGLRFAQGRKLPPGERYPPRRCTLGFRG